MNIVIVGAKDRESEDDYADVEALLTQLEAKYSQFTVLSVMGHAGIGKIVKILCSKKLDKGKHRLPFCEADVKVFASTLNSNEMTQLYTARNAMLYEIGDVFYHFPHPQRRSVLDELINRRVVPNGRPHKIFHCGDVIDIDTTVAGLV